MQSISREETKAYPVVKKTSYENSPDLENHYEIWGY